MVRGRRKVLLRLDCSPLLLLLCVFCGIVLKGCETKRVKVPPLASSPARPPVQVPALDTPEEKAQGVYHVVRKGETLWRICKAYGANLQQVAELNNIRDPSQIKEGQKIFIPGVSGRVMSSRQIDRHGVPEEEPKIETFPGKFVWPVKGEVSSPFGVRNGMKHSGIDILAPKGTSVLAAASGEAIYTGQLKGYGNIVILRHSDEFTTVYAHLDEVMVKEHEKVQQGQMIATVGNTGRSEGSHLHFEIRVKNVARNPLFYLPDPPR